MAMIRVSQSKLTGRIASRRKVEIRITKSGYLWARQPGGAREERFKRDPLGVWRMIRAGGSLSLNYRVWLEEEKDGN